MQTIEMENCELVDYLKDCGICEICQLRYLKARGDEYENIKETFESLGVNYEYNETSDDVASKKPRFSLCPCCLGLFSKEFKDELIEKILATDISDYECDNIVLSLSFPILLQIRQLSMWLALRRKFGSKIDEVNAPDVPLKEAAKLIINPIICKKLNKNYDVNDGVMISITLKHSNEIEEIESLEQLHKELYSDNKKKKRPIISRGLLEKDYSPKTISNDIFEKHLSTPPVVPKECLTIESVTLTGPTIFVAGRYRKISRQLSHTPWVLNGQRMMEDSIEEIILRTVAPYFRCDRAKSIFMSSGREDVDVRCLGKGRPFALELPDSKVTTLNQRQAHKMELEIDGSSKVSIRNLQIVNRDDLVHIKNGEDKRKLYRALCKLNEPVTVEMLKKLNQPNGFEILQKTPIRVLHRRPLHTRPRSIYSLKAYVQRDNPCILVLDIISQAGTYIKELVHGEFGRTTPSIYSMISQPIDILALDVVGVDLDWPKEVDNSIQMD